jgi:DNA-binding transcriptional ArsR family regulator
MKSEIAYREILMEGMEEKRTQFTVRGIARKAGIPASTVSHALKPLKEVGAVTMQRRGFRLSNAKKVLLYWCSIRNLASSIVYKTRVDMDVGEMEGSVPPGAIFTAYTAFKIRFGSVPAEYGEVVVYGMREDFERRFGKGKTGEVANLIVLETDPHLERLGRATLAQIYVDLWNLRSWYAQDFLNALEKVI